MLSCLFFGLFLANPFPYMLADTHEANHSFMKFLPMELKKKVMKQGRGRNEHRNMRALIKHRESRRAMFVIVETRFFSSRPNLQTNWNRYFGRNTFSGRGMNAYRAQLPENRPDFLAKKSFFLLSNEKCWRQLFSRGLGGIHCEMSHTLIGRVLRFMNLSHNF